MPENYIENSTDIKSVLKRAEKLVSREEIEACYDNLGVFITEQYSHLQPVLVAVLNGGLRVASELMQRCNFPMEVESIRVRRYRNGTTGGDLEWLAEPALCFQARHVILVDDVLDEGHTLAALQKKMQQQQPASLCTLVLVQKAISHEAVAKVSQAGLQLPNRFLIGEGMDVAGYGRNLNGIWALAQTDQAYFHSHS